MAVGIIVSRKNGKESRNQLPDPPRSAFPRTASPRLDPAAQRNVASAGLVQKYRPLLGRLPAAKIVSSVVANSEGMDTWENDEHLPWSWWV
jgi:hypothetical protein